jgi:hypothetical protein
MRMKLVNKTNLERIVLPNPTWLGTGFVTVEGVGRGPSEGQRTQVNLVALLPGSQRRLVAMLTQ